MFKSYFELISTVNVIVAEVINELTGTWLINEMCCNIYFHIVSTYNLFSRFYAVTHNSYPLLHPPNLGYVPQYSGLMCKYLGYAIDGHPVLPLDGRRHWFEADMLLCVTEILRFSTNLTPQSSPATSAPSLKAVPGRGCGGNVPA